MVAEIERPWKGLYWPKSFQALLEYCGGQRAASRLLGVCISLLQKYVAGAIPRKVVGREAFRRVGFTEVELPEIHPRPARRRRGEVTKDSGWRELLTWYAGEVRDEIRPNKQSPCPGTRIANHRGRIANMRRRMGKRFDEPKWSLAWLDAKYPTPEKRT